MALGHLLTGVAVLGLMAQSALAQSQDPATQQQPGQLAEVDVEFANEAAQGGLMEVRFGELAQQQAKSPEVKQFGERMVEDHGKATDQLMQIAQQKGIELPQDLSDDAQAAYDELQQQSGAEFDEAYMDEMVGDHEEDIAAFEDYVDGAEDQDLRSFAEETLPTLREHLEMAKQTQEQVAGATGEAQPEAAMAGDQADTGMVSFEDVLGSTVVNSAGEEIAEIDDIVAKDQTSYAVMSVGGFLGIGDKDVAIPLDQLKRGEGSYLMSPEIEEQLQDMPEYEETQYQPLSR